MQVSRCCCTPGPVSGCDSITTGWDDDFLTLQSAGPSGGGWVWSVPLGVTPQIQPAGYLLIDYDPVLIGNPSTFNRCAVWATNFASLRYHAVGQWQSGYYGSEDAAGLLTGFSLFADLSTNIYALQHRIRWQAGVGWRHEMALFPDTVDEVTNLVGNVIQVNRDPAPQGPFAFNMTMHLSRDPTGLWVATTFWYANTIIPALPIPTPNAGAAEFQHGFSLGFSTVAASVDRWTYTPELR